MTAVNKAIEIVRGIKKKISKSTLGNNKAIFLREVEKMFGIDFKAFLNSIYLFHCYLFLHGSLLNSSPQL
jgi:hypothetical protein